jgi:hypothetical protein
MHVPTHYNALDDKDILRDLYALGYGGSPLLEYVCQRWEQLVDGEKDAEAELANAIEAKDDAEMKRDALLDEIKP